MGRGGGLNLSIPFLFVKTIEIVIRLRTVSNIFLSNIFEDMGIFAFLIDRLTGIKLLISGAQHFPIAVDLKKWEGGGRVITKVRVHTGVPFFTPLDFCMISS